MSEEIVEELRLLALETDESRGPGDVSMRIFEIIEKLEALPPAPEPKPETPEAETARLSLEFVKWAGLPVRCNYNPLHSTLTHPLDDACINPRPAAPLTADVVLDLLGAHGFIWKLDNENAFDDATAPYWVFLKKRRKPERYVESGRTKLLALLRAADATGVMDKED